MVRIARALESDIPQLLQLLQALFTIEQDFAADAACQQRGLKRLLAEPGDRAALFVARVGGDVAGMASGQLVISTAEGAPSVWIEDVIVAEHFRSRGIGRALLRSVLDWACAQGATRAQLLADRDNAAAIAFYRRVGLDTTNLIALRLPGIGD
jgi:ribosomal protein S18 acetylase RimI-like enzyme